MTDYAVLKAVHIGSAVLSIGVFTVRGLLMLGGSPLIDTRFARVAPHIVDTILLATAIGLAWLSGQYPFAQSWLTAKVAALVLYIFLGTIALRRGPTLRVRAVAFALALCTALYMVSVALARSPTGPFAL